MPTPFLSVIIPCYNAENNILQSVLSVVNQDDTDCEIILVNDGSADNTLTVINELAAQYKAVKVVNKSNGGVSSARNAGLSIAQGEYVSFLDSDDFYERSFITRVKQQAGAEMIIFGWRYEKSKGNFVDFQPFDSLNQVSDYLLCRLRIHIGSLVVRRSILKEFGIEFTEGTHFSEDIEFITKCLLYSKDIRSDDEILFNYNWCPTSAMRLSEYSSKKITSVYAMERIYLMLKNSRHEKAALATLKLSIVTHQKLFIKSKCEDNRLKLILDEFARKYLSISTPLASNKISLFVYVMSVAYKCPFIYNIFLRMFAAC